MNILSFVSKTSSFANSKQVKVLDWVTALSLLAWGAYAAYFRADGDSMVMPITLLSLGALGCLMAYKRPAELVNLWVKRSLFKKKG